VLRELWFKVKKRLIKAYFLEKKVLNNLKFPEIGAGIFKNSLTSNHFEQFALKNSKAELELAHSD
jgi:hypothetical protein